jgi:hypothetical protein
VTPEVRRLVVVAAVAAVFAAVHALCARALAGSDLLGALLTRLDLVTLLLAVVLALTRTALFFLVPGWLAYRIARALLARAGSRALVKFSEPETSARRV